MDKNIRITCVGDGSVGKTCLLCTYARQNYPENYIPTVFETFQVHTEYKDEKYVLNIHDTGGKEEWEALRTTAYPSTDIIVLCFSLVSSISILNLKEKWIPEILKYLPNTPIVLVGTMCDLRSISNKTIESVDNGENKILIITTNGLKLKIKAYKYIECSALTQTNVNQVFEACICAYNNFKYVKRRKSSFISLFSCFQPRSAL